MVVSTSSKAQHLVSSAPQLRVCLHFVINVFMRVFIRVLNVYKSISYLEGNKHMICHQTIPIVFDVNEYFTGSYILRKVGQ